MTLYRDGFEARYAKESALLRRESTLESVEALIEDQEITTLEDLLAALKEKVVAATVDLAIVMDGRYEEFNKEHDEWSLRAARDRAAGTPRDG